MKRHHSVFQSFHLTKERSQKIHSFNSADENHLVLSSNVMDWFREPRVPFRKYILFCYSESLFLVALLLRYAIPTNLSNCSMFSRKDYVVFSKSWESWAVLWVCCFFSAFFKFFCSVWNTIGFLTQTCKNTLNFHLWVH